MRTLDSSGARIRWISQVSPVVSSELVFAPGIVSVAGGPANQLRLFAMRRSTGAIAWSTALAASATVLSLESQSTPAIDLAHESVLVAHASTLSCLRLSDGSLRWQAALPRLVVNASPLIVHDSPGRHRAFITTFDAGLGTGGELVCINLSPFDATHNPFAPGAIVWRVGIGGSSGNSPASLPRARGGQGAVWVASAGTYAASPAEPGMVFAFDASASTAPAPLWTATNSTSEGFYGGIALCVDRALPRPLLACASYAFSGGLASANLLALDAGTGQGALCAASNRSSSVPVFLPGGLLLLSTGLASSSVSDTAPALELFAPPLSWGALGPSCSGSPRLWNSAISTWTDSNNDGLLSQGEFAPLGHYVHHPAVSVFAGESHALAGVAPSGDRVSPPTQLLALNLAQSPASPGFVAQVAGVQVGSSPALAGLNVYSSGADGLAAFGVPPAQLDVDASVSTLAVVDLSDLHAWEAGTGSRDIDASGSTSTADRALLLLALRSRERAALLQGPQPHAGGAP